MANFFKNKRNSKLIQDKIENLNIIDRNKFNVTLVETLILIKDFNKTKDLLYRNTNINEEQLNKIMHFYLECLMLYVCYNIIIYNSASFIKLTETDVVIEYHDYDDDLSEYCNFSIQEEYINIIHILEEYINEVVVDSYGIIDILYDELDILTSELFNSEYIKNLIKFIVVNDINDINIYDVIPVSIIDYKNNLFRVKILFIVDRNQNDYIEY